MVRHLRPLHTIRPCSILEISCNCHFILWVSLALSFLTIRKITLRHLVIIRTCPYQINWFLSVSWNKFSSIRTLFLIPSFDILSRLKILRDLRGISIASQIYFLRFPIRKPCLCSIPYTTDIIFSLFTTVFFGFISLPCKLTLDIATPIGLLCVSLARLTYFPSRSHLQTIKFYRPLYTQLVYVHPTWH